MITKDGCNSTIAPTGELVTKGLDSFVKEAYDALHECDDAKLDLSQVIEIDSAGLQALVALKNHAKANNIKLTITKTSAVMDEILQLYNITLAHGSEVVDA